jgi:hypothetical protein
VIGTREVSSAPAMRAALTAFAFAAVTVGWTLVRATRSPVISTAAPAPVPSTAAISAALRGASINVRAAVDADPFAEDRSAPSKRYRLPGEHDASSDGAVDAPKPVVLGTAVSGGGRSFATCQLGGEEPTIVRIGDRIGSYTVKSIERGRVVFTTKAGDRLEIAALRPES